jgi:IS30 family transposase
MRRSTATSGATSAGGTLYLFLRGSRKQKWKRYRSYDSRGRMRGKRPISERPPGAENRSRVGHLEGDTVIGAFDRHCILTLVDRKTGYVMIGKLFGRTTAATNRRAASLIRNAPRRNAVAHGGQRDRVSRLQGLGESDRSTDLLRHPSSLLGARHQ